MSLTKYKIGDLIQQRREKYDGSKDLPVRGVSRDGFILPKQDNADLSIYNVFYQGDFVFNPARMELNSIALNLAFEKGICSSLYEIFYITKPDIVLPEYLNLFIKREEFARKCGFEAVGSARNYFRVSNLAEFEIELPSIPIQQRYVDIYNSMLINQQCYEKGLGDLSLLCHSFVEKLRKTVRHHRLGEYISKCEDSNEQLLYGKERVRGISVEKNFIDTKANMTDVSLKPYMLVRPNEFAYVADTSRRGDKIALARNNSDDTYICSSAYTVFKINNTNKLLPEYLSLLLERREFNRYARFHSWGSARETFDWETMCDVHIPLPDIEVQRSIVDIYKVYNIRKEINEKLKAQLKDICPILIKGSIEEAKKLRE
jgi:restriction endonuclease S subunit